LDDQSFQIFFTFLKIQVFHFLWVIVVLICFDL
jgi:hypothetical protein